MHILGTVLPYLFASVFTQSEEAYPLVTTFLGSIEGHYRTSYNGRVYAAFEGIPYARPPIGSLRFREPVDIEPWNGIWNATRLRTCIQLSNLEEKSGVLGEEDCLYLNVYIPKKLPSPADKYDVVVHIHGGSFLYGGSIIAMPTFLMDRDIVYVSLNYRLGILGFLSTEDEVVPGNNGMKDQVLALRWVQQHIRQFGGNPNSVTLVGVSAGAAATHLHYFSKLSQGLFHRGISHSGTALSPAVIQQNALERAQYIATLLGCTISSNIEMIECLRQKPAEQVVDKVRALYIKDTMLPLIPLGPVIEKKHKTAFIDDHPYNLLKTGKVYDVPWIGSVTKDEGFLTGLVALGPSIKKIDTIWNDIAPSLLSYQNSSCKSDRSFISEKIRRVQFQENPISSDLKRLMVLCGERIFTNSLQIAANMHSRAQKSLIYTYMYGYKASFAKKNYKMFSVNDENIVSHTDDSALMYEDIMYDIKPNYAFSKDDVELKEWFMELYSTYASGNDISKLATTNRWTPVDSSSKDFTYLYVRNFKNIKMETETNTSSISFWDSLPLMEKQIKPKDACPKNVNQEKSKL